jgi:hypothetical protein
LEVKECTETKVRDEGAGREARETETRELEGVEGGGFLKRRLRSQGVLRRTILKKAP